jgi:hypothetical protein
VGGFSVLDGVRKPCDALSSVGFLGTVGLIAEMVHAHRAGPPVPQYFTLHGGKTDIPFLFTQGLMMNSWQCYDVAGVARLSHTEILRNPGKVYIRISSI